MDACTCGTPYTMTMAEWKAKHRDFKSTSRVDGRIVRSALRYCPAHGTTLAPVTIVKADTAVQS